MRAFVLILVGLLLSPDPALAWGWSYIQCTLERAPTQSIDRSELPDWMVRDLEIIRPSGADALSSETVVYRFKNGHFQELDDPNQRWGPNLCEDNRVIGIESNGCAISRSEIDVSYRSRDAGSGTLPPAREDISISRQSGQIQLYYGRYMTSGRGSLSASGVCSPTRNPLAGRGRRF